MPVSAAAAAASGVALGEAAAALGVASGSAAYVLTAQMLASPEQGALAVPLIALSTSAITAGLTAYLATEALAKAQTAVCTASMRSATAALRRRRT